MKQLILWIKPGDPPSERVRLLAQHWGVLISSDISLKISCVDSVSPEVSRVPCLQFCLGDQIVYCLEENLTLEKVLEVFRKLG